MAMLLTSTFAAQGAGLGKLSVHSAHSAVGQPLNAEVALSATPDELGSMTATLASHEAFREAGIRYMPLLADMRISLDKNAAGQPILRLTTLRPISEPSLHFLVELSWTSGRMVREYILLLNPPEMLQVAKPASVVAPSVPDIKPSPPAAAREPSEPAAAAPEKPAPAPGDYRVKQGDTLGKIARETRPEAVTLDQMLVALFNGNQDAFVGNNMNRLRAGEILRLPGLAEASKIDPAEARKLVISHAGEFNAYRNRLAGAAATLPAPATAPQQQVSGTIKPQVEDKVPAPAAGDKLEVSRTEPAKTALTSSGLEEDLVARDKALREALERIAQLEKNIENLKKLAEVKSQTGAKLQQESEAIQPKPAEKPAEPVKTEAPAAPPPAPVTTSEPAAKQEEAEPAAEPPKPAEAAAPPAAAKKPAPPPPPPPPPSPEPGFIDENPELVYGGGGLIVLLLAYLGYSSWRRKKVQADKSVTESAAPLAATTGVPEAQSATPGAPATATGDIFGAAPTVAETVEPVLDNVEPAVTGGLQEEAGAASALVIPEGLAGAPVGEEVPLPDFELDLGSPVEPDVETSAAVAQQVESVPDEAPGAGGIGELKFDFDLELDQGLASTAAAEPVVEETDLDRVLDSPPAEEPGPETPAAVGKPDNPEVTIKLELAQAYEEMGDFEGARELLNEVLNEGSESQQAQARAKLELIGA